MATLKPVLITISDEGGEQVAELEPTTLAGAKDELEAALRRWGLVNDDETEG